MQIDETFENYKKIEKNCTIYEKDTKAFKNIFLKNKRKEVEILNIFSYFLSKIIRTPEFLIINHYIPNYILFESHFSVIRKEILDFIEINNIKSFKETKNTYNNSGIGLNSNTNDNAWRLFCIKEFNNYSKDICNFPVLKKILDKNYEIANCFISILEPRTHIPIHKGYFKGILRLMFPIKIPKDKKNCFLWLNGIKYNWIEGKCVLWDDIYPHKVYNNTDETRIVLYMDIYRLPKNKIFRKVVFRAIDKFLNIQMIKNYKTKYIKSTEIIKKLD